MMKEFLDKEFNGLAINIWLATTLILFAFDKYPYYLIAFVIAFFGFILTEFRRIR